MTADQKPGVMEFGGTVVRSPEDLATHQIWIHSKVMIDNWGDKAPERYMEALRKSGNMSAVEPNVSPDPIYVPLGFRERRYFSPRR